ncbi:E3 ubiquitin-protein ligase Mdm2-like [Hydractinia symbiolongicarpus]|uniref:E3 ubiquitin-protein ligase Mdm2-like n=1 Tax=Hydractinia symbiolongicarpus TaxID=13093 RepID=UPI00254A0244|nr:E3 ubiquitin-protein ligase Mdm2-like [Hydractinia symbiolongicarpus]
MTNTVAELRHLAGESDDGSLHDSDSVFDTDEDMDEDIDDDTDDEYPGFFHPMGNISAPRSGGSRLVPDPIEPHQPAILDYDIDTLDESEKCIICYSQRKEATIVHGNTGQFCCCLSCASILKSGGDKCPICRASIDLVIRQYN